MSAIGQPLLRREDACLVTGRGRYVGDIAPEGCLHVAFVRSGEAHGRIDGIETEDALEMPGVVAVYTGADVAHLGELPVNALIDNLTLPGWPVLARDKVYAVGQPLAAVIAESPAQALDAADLVYAEIEALDPVMDGVEGPDIFEAVPGNRAASQRWAAGDVDAAFAAADRVVSVEIPYPRLAPTTLEPRAALAEWREDGMTVWLSTQTPHRARTDLADIAGLDFETLRVIAPDVGGAFGMKASLYPEDALTAWAAARLKRPVKWTATRGEDLLSATHARNLTVKGDLALSKDGDLLGLRATTVALLGHWLPYSGGIPPRNAARILPGPYRVPAVDIHAAAYLSTTAPVGIYRGAGRPEAAMLMERLMDAAARALDMDPVELRRRNLLGPEAMPYRTPTGETFDSGDFPALLDALVKAADYRGLRAETARRRASGEIAGIGLCLYVEPCGAGWENARVGLGPDGSIVAATGSSAQGQGRETAFAQIVADAVGVVPEQVIVLEGDTATTPKGVGALASRSTPIGGGAMLQAASIFRDIARVKAAELLQANSDVLTVTAQGFSAGDAVLSWTALAEAAPDLSAEANFETEDEAWGSGAVLAQVSIEAETGEPRIEDLLWIDDAGTVINPMLVEGQLHGGIAQAIGEVLLERIVYDADGQLLTGSFMDYGIPRAADIPPVAIQKRSTPSPRNPLGAKGVGEAGTIGAPPAIMNAFLDALAPFGVQDIQMPVSSEAIWRAINSAEEER
jgi:carbon-monoxide dehydrogenase large subunit